MKKNGSPLRSPLFGTNRDVRRELIFLSAFSVLIFFVVHWCYPSPYTTPDSPDYVLCAKMKVFGGFRPVGYSWFLQLVHAFSFHIGYVMLAQFLLHLISALYLIFTIRAVFPPSRLWLFRALAFLVVTNDLSLYMTTWLLSDSINASLIFIAFAALLRLSENPGKKATLALMIVALYFSLQTRYAGMAFVPAFIISLLTVQPLRKIYVHTGLLVALFAVVWTDGVLTNVSTFGEHIFSAFGGWAQANNASILLPHVRVDTSGWTDREACEAYRDIRSYDDSNFSEKKIFLTDFI